MTGNWASSNRRTELPANWPQIRKAVARRAGNQCEWTGDPILDGHGSGQDGPDGDHRCTHRGTDCDHKNDRNDHRIESLQWLCTGHHKVKTQAEAIEAANAQRERLTHPATRARHPGLIN